MEQEKIKAYFQMWSEAWKQFKKWAEEFRDDDSFWEKAVKDSEAFAARYKGTDLELFARRTLITILEELETISTTKRGKT